MDGQGHLAGPEQNLGGIGAVYNLTMDPYEKYDMTFVSSFAGVPPISEVSLRPCAVTIKRLARGDAIRRAISGLRHHFGRKIAASSSRDAKQRTKTKKIPIYGKKTAPPFLPKRGSDFGRPSPVDGFSYELKSLA